MKQGSRKRGKDQGREGGKEEGIRNYFFLFRALLS